MLTLSQQPAELSWSRNNLLFRFQSTDANGDLYGATGVQAELRTTSFFGIPEDESFDVLWTESDGSENSISFTAKDDPTDIDHIPSKDAPGFIGWTDYWILVSEALRAHPVLGPLFTFSVEHSGTGDSLFIEAPEDWEVSIDITNLSDVRFSTHVHPAVEDNTPSNYRVLVDVFFEENKNAGDFKLITQLSAIPGPDGYTAFDISETIDAAIKLAMGNLPIPAFEDNTPILADTIRRYYIRYREDYDDIDPVEWVYFDIQRAICGGVSNPIFANYDFFGAMTEGNSLLTWYPDQKNISAEQPEWIAWYNYSNSIQNVIIELRRFTSTGALTVLFKFEGNNVDVAPGEVLLIPVGYSQLAINNTSVQKYQVRVVDAEGDYENTPVYMSQPRTFYVDHSYYRNKRYIMYLNGFCCPETLRCVGHQETDLEVDRLESQRILEPFFTSSSPQEIQFDQDWVNTFTFRSGYLSRIEVDALQELLVYNKAWEVFEDGYIPLHLTDKRFRIYNSREYLYSVEFKARPRLRQRNYSNVLIPVADGQEAWLTDTETYWQTALGQPWQIP